MGQEGLTRPSDLIIPTCKTGFNYCLFGKCLEINTFSEVPNATKNMLLVTFFLHKNCVKGHDGLVITDLYLNF